MLNILSRDGCRWSVSQRANFAIVKGARVVFFGKSSGRNINGRWPLKDVKSKYLRLNIVRVQDEAACALEGKLAPAEAVRSRQSRGPAVPSMPPALIKYSQYESWSA